MTERKPAGMSFESWVDKQIREATERGELDNLPGAGKPLPDSNRPLGEHWWLKGYLKREGLSTDPLLPTPLRLRKELDRLPETVRPLPTEEQVRERVLELNREIAACIRSGAGPRVRLAPADLDAVLEQWRSERRRQGPEPAGTAPAQRPKRRRWWRRRR
ncbi:DUF1992 domain-containing protein [Amycolatopsis cihanbeyliensis]|uniref:Uncharacterized protein DUF1992 n=1 Tax=Amycolatopsis cihanbeyliensis TaxID=1128664 RepID=A0A542DHC5_AMYCI|nr:DUF1992 domain-containing protein [Amycolatopsis cihanbeyliensis]TQJ02440.1 uncharacterized protein DUF1992 [Amycolatopsis cihanbeyliensis]